MSGIEIALIALVVAGGVIFWVVFIGQWLRRHLRRLTVADYRASLGPAPPPDACGPQAVWGTVQTHFCTKRRGHPGLHGNADYLWTGADSAYGPAPGLEVIIRRSASLQG